ncbi:MAG: hypothetical protein FJX67_18720 [Alphaproteobacteria bacterium]|nr:hypothetical protein [Alphaproteobacteria bacterium]
MLGLSSKQRIRSGVDSIRVGAIFGRTLPDNVVEKARVVNLGKGPSGIPHVFFHLSFERSNRPIGDTEPRTLALRAFVERFPEPIAS